MRTLISFFFLCLSLSAFSQIDHYQEKPHRSQSIGVFVENNSAHDTYLSGFGLRYTREIFGSFWRWDFSGQMHSVEEGIHPYGFEPGGFPNRMNNFSLFFDNEYAESVTVFARFGLEKEMAFLLAESSQFWLSGLGFSYGLSGEFGYMRQKLYDHEIMVYFQRDSATGTVSYLDYEGNWTTEIDRIQLTAMEEEIQTNKYLLFGLVSHATVHTHLFNEKVDLGLQMRFGANYFMLIRENTIGNEDRIEDATNDFTDTGALLLLTTFHF